MWAVDEMTHLSKRPCAATPSLCSRVASSANDGSFVLRYVAIILMTGAGVLGSGVAPTPASASPQKWTCDCIPPDEEMQSCFCKSGFEYSMKGLANKTFQGFCSAPVTGDHTLAVTPLLRQAGGKNIACMITYDVPGVLSELNCTNLNFIRKTVSFNMTCIRTKPNQKPYE